VLAEGIETAPELSALRGLGVEYAQGFLLGRPVSPPLEEMFATVGADGTLS
jgi:EAL domain-containing protein (putative c-di-GMP-specific phosphodiesterase class I)